MLVFVLIRLPERIEIERDVAIPKRRLFICRVESVESLRCEEVQPLPQFVPLTELVDLLSLMKLRAERAGLNNR